MGRRLGKSLKGFKIFDHRMVSLLKVAEEINQTKFTFERLDQQYNIGVQQKSKQLSTLYTVAAYYTDTGHLSKCDIGRLIPPHVQTWKYSRVG